MDRKELGITESGNGLEPNRIEQSSLEWKLSFLHQDRYIRMCGGRDGQRVGTAAFFVTNESPSLNPIPLDQRPDGYIVGTGNGNIWSMLEEFPAGIPPKGVIAIDYDPSVILSGIVLVELAKRRLSLEELIACIYGDAAFPEWTVSKTVHLAEDMARRESQEFKRVLLASIDDETFIRDINIARRLHEGLLHEDLQRRKTISSIFDRQWNSIIDLAMQGNIFFIYGDIGNDIVLNGINEQVPDLKYSKNIFYISNIVDTRYRTELATLQRLNPEGKSWYVYTTHYPDDYMLQYSHALPKRVTTI